MADPNRRIQKELSEVRQNGVPGFLSLKVDDANIRVWEGVILPKKIPYNKGAFRIQITFPDSYPFKPPTIIFKTMIYHPNIDEKGNVCLSVISTDKWKPATRIAQVIDALISLINDPEPEHALRVEIAEQFTKELAKFKKSAEEFTKKHAEKRPIK